MKPIPEGQPPPGLLAGYKANFHTLQRAFENGDVALLSAIRSADRMPVAVVCAVQQDGKEFEFGRWRSCRTATPMGCSRWSNVAARCVWHLSRADGPVRTLAAGAPTDPS